MQLHYREYGQRSHVTPTVLLLHGLFGSAANWHGIARRMQTRFHVLSPDLRNHGRSPHAARMDYPAMAEDILELVDALGLEQVCLVGHSMGGKAAMWLALEHQERVWSLVVVDIAPVVYAHDFSDLLDALESIPLKSLDNRTAADRTLAQSLDSEALRGYLLQNLVKEDGRWAWRVNLPALRHAMAQIVGFPEPAHNRQFPGDTLFLYGGRSNYLTPSNTAAARRLFPHARLRMIPQAGHWVYSDAPDAFVDTLGAFLSVG
jgi:esterase